MSETVDPTAAGEGPASTKVDPETLVLRARPERAIRFKRGAIVGLAALASASVAGVSWVALKPHALQLASEPEDMAGPGTASADALGDLPTSYSEAPRLGQPLPGDLGRPILQHQRAVLPQSVDGADQRLAQAAEAARERTAAESKAARESGVLVQASGRELQPAPASGEPQGGASPEPVPAKLALDLDRDPNAQQRKADFVAAHDSRRSANPHRLEAASSPYLLSAGSVISASLITGLRSDMPGLVTAQVTERVFDSPTGRTILIPQGARLIGSYDSVVAFGQKRALVIWQRIVFPDGSSLALDNVPAADASGYAGLVDKVDLHTWSLLKGVALSTLLGMGSSLSFSGESDLVQAIRQSTQQNGARAGDQLTSRNLQVQPTITIRAGTPVRLVVHRDLILAPWRG
jgi:type IV secretion system protein VirB10